MEELTRLEELQSIYWDLYKDAYGIRPRGIDTSNWAESAFNNEFDQLAAVIRRNESERHASEQQAVRVFEERILALQASGAGDRATALRWIHEAEGSNGDDNYLCFVLGLPYRYLNCNIVAPVSS